MTLTPPTAAWHDPADNHPAGLSAPSFTQPVHCAMFAVDITAFGRRRDADTQQHLRGGLYRIVKDACDAAGMPWMICHPEDRGDGILLIAPPVISAERLDQAAAHLCAGLRRHNKHTTTTAKIQLRMAIHAGYVHRDPNGFTGKELVHLFRLLDAPQFKAQLATSHTEFALITSDYLYKEIIKPGPGLIEPTTYRPLTITNKDTNTTAWTWQPTPTQPPQKHKTRTIKEPRTRPLKITRHDVEITLLLAAGRTYEDIADELGIQPRDVEARICHILAELCLTTSNPTAIATTLTNHLQSRNRH